MAQTFDESRARLLASVQQQAEELAEINRIALALTSEFDLQSLLQTMTDAARKITSAEYAAFFLIPEMVGEKNQLPSIESIFELAAISGTNEQIKKHFTHLGPVQGLGLLSPVFNRLEGSSVIVDDVYQHPAYIGIPRGHIPVRSFLGIQLRSREDTILGAFLIGHTLTNRFTTRHVELMEVLSSQAAVAIHNAQLIMRERQAMETYATHLESEVRERTAELEQRNQELSIFATNLQQLHHELTEAQKKQMLSEERNRIAQELHDRVQQTLFTIALKADWISERLPSDSLLIHSLRSIRELVSLGTAQVRDAIFALSSAENTREGLIQMLSALIQELRQSSALEADLVVTQWANPLSSHMEYTLFTVAQEALSNVRRHANATTVIMTVQVTSAQAMLVVQDNGQGLSPQELQGYRKNTLHLGLKGMHQRIEALGGQFTIANGEEGGLIVKVVVPR